jgi:hypothetical protein
MIPDYVLQVQEIQRNLETQTIVTRENWQDSVAQRFYDNFIQKYEDTIYLYIHGGIGITGMGLDELLRFFDQKQNEMSQLTGMGLNIDTNFGGKVHNEYRERDPWNKHYDGTQPGNLNAGEVKEIMNERDYNH